MTFFSNVAAKVMPGTQSLASGAVESTKAAVTEGAVKVASFAEDNLLNNPGISAIALGTACFAVSPLTTGAAVAVGYLAADKGLDAKSPMDKIGDLWRKNHLNKALIGGTAIVGACFLPLPLTAVTVGILGGAYLRSQAKA